MNRWLRLAAYLVLAAAGAMGIWRVESIAHEARRTADQVENQQMKQCEAIDQLILNLGWEFRADQETIDRFLDQFHQDTEAC